MTRQTVGNESRNGNLNATTITSASVTATNLTTTGTATFTGVTATGAGVVDQALQYSAEDSVLRNLPARVHPAEALLKQAVWWIDSAHSDSARQRVENLGWGGSALDAQLGSANSGLRIEPLDGYVYLPGVAGNSLSVPDEAALDITGDLTIVARVQVDSWTGVQYIVAKGTDTTGFNYGLEARDKLVLRYTAGGTTYYKAATGHPLSNGVTYWIKVTLDVDNGAAGHDVKFFYASDQVAIPTSWTQIGATVTTAGTLSLTTNTDPVTIGTMQNGVYALAGKVYRAQVLNGIDGTKVLDIDCSQAVIDRPQFTALTGQVVTINDTSRDSNDAKYLDWMGENYVYLPGVNSNLLSVPDEAALDITGDLDIRVRVALDDWTPANFQILVDKYGGAGNRSYRFGMNNSLGKPFFEWSPDGTTELGYTSTAGNTFSDGDVKWLRVTLDVDNGASGRDVKFYLSDDGVSWSQLGSTHTTAGTTSVYASTTPLRVGTRASLDLPMSGKVYRAQVLNGIDGTPVLDIDCSAVASGAATSFTARTGQTVTINRSTSGRKAVAVVHPVWLLGTDDTIIVADSALIDLTAGASLSAFLVYRRWNGEDSKRLLTKKNAVSPFAGWQLNTTGTSHGIVAVTTDSTVTNYAAFSPTGTAGALTAVAGVWNGGTNQVTAYLNGVAGTPSSVAAWGDCSNAEILAAGAGSNLGTFTDMELVAALVFRRALSSDEITTLTNYYSARIGA